LEDEKIMEDLLGFIILLAIMAGIAYWGFKE
jgi:hypothetical protein